MDKRKIIVGDVHGCLLELEELLKKLDYQRDKDQLYFVGDLINKGPNSKGVLDLAMAEEAICVMGNHEWGFLKFLENESYKKNFTILKEHFGDELDKYVEYIKTFPLYWEEEDFLLVHAGISPLHLEDLANEKPKVLTTIRTWDGKGEDLNNKKDPAWFELYQKDKLIVFGHWATLGLVERENAIGLDSGCLYGNQLSSLVLPSREIVQVQAAQCYYPIK